LSLLADAFHRIYEIEVEPQGNDIVDAKSIAEKLNIEIIIYGVNRQILYSTVAAAAKSITVY
jgi:hypothetical protein